jgi:hypothetical protein
VAINKGEILKKFIALLLIFSLASISCITTTTQRQKRFASSKEQKHGAKLIITKKDRVQIRGELIIVKPNSLLLLDGLSGLEMSVDIKDIKIIKIINKSNYWKGSLYGLVIGGGFGAATLVSRLSEPNGDASLVDIIGGAAFFVGIGGAVGFYIGGIIGSTSRTERTIYFQGLSDSEIQETLDKLRKKARIRDYK